MLSDYAVWIAFGSIALVIVLAWGITAASGGAMMWSASEGRRFGRRRPSREHFRPEDVTHAVDETPRKRPAIIVNPTKFDDLDALRTRVTGGCLGAGWGEPLWLETTAEDPGTGQASRALEAGAAIICPLGGDGTVRAVAAALVGTETPMGLLPGGTGNLLARNLQLPVDSIDDALRVALTGQNKRVDVGRLTVDQSGEHEHPEEHIFLVMAGVGFDAAVVADAPERLKRAVGPLAYTVSGFKNLRGPQFKVRVTIDDDPEFTRRVRTVVIGNCGKLTGGLVLLPEAQLDDGWLDAVLLSPQGLVGWMAVWARLASKKRKGHQRVDHRRLRSLSIRADRPEEVQLDGDTIGKARALAATVDPLALIVRVG